MSNRIIVILFLTQFMVLVSGVKSLAQFQQLPTPVPQHQVSYSNARINQTPLNLPFWDDFSKIGIDTAKWINEGTTQSFTIGNAPPTLGVLLLDGVDERGSPYSQNRVEQGITDQITSKPIDLSQVTPDEINSVFLSFYWQAGGKGEMPDFNDDLNLLFLNKDGIWVNMWSVSGDIPEHQEFFTPEIIQVTEEFQHENFQFRFQITGRASGPFDTWIIDYVYLNKNRNANNLFFADRALTSYNSRPSQGYSAIPLFELKKNPDLFWTKTGNEFNNLDNRFRAMEFSIELRDKADNAIISRINDNTPFNPVPLASERRAFESNNFSNIRIPSQETDYELITYLSSGDGILFQIVNGDTLFYNDVDLRVNDTVKTTIPFRDFFAYDDGSVDYSAGINQRNGMLANRFEVQSPVYVKGISINFTNLNQANNVIDLMVWSSLNNEPVFVKEVFIPEKDDINEFAYFEVAQNVLVDDSFFVGFTQFTNDFIFVGLDKTYDNGNQTFFNVAGSWQQNELVQGSLMIRVHLSETPIIEEESQVHVGFKIFPNPVQDWLYIEGNVDGYNIFDPYGRSINLPEETYEDGKMIKFAGLQKGVYVINLIQGKEQKSIRVLVR